MPSPPVKARFGDVAVRQNKEDALDAAEAGGPSIQIIQCQGAELQKEKERTQQQCESSGQMAAQAQAEGGGLQHTVLVDELKRYRQDLHSYLEDWGNRQEIMFSAKLGGLKSSCPKCDSTARRSSTLECRSVPSFDSNPASGSLSPRRRFRFLGAPSMKEHIQRSDTQFTQVTQVTETPQMPPKRCSHTRRRSFMREWLGDRYHVPQEREQQPRGRLAPLVGAGRFAWHFDMGCAGIILLNAAVIGYESDVNMRTALDPDRREAELLLKAAELCFAVFYLIELLIKIEGLRWQFLIGLDWRWNVFDALVVLSSIYDQAANYVVALQADGANMSFLRVLRIIKMLKMFRVVRVMKLFRELRLLISSVVGSVKSMFWSIMMILIVTYLFGVCFLQAATLRITEPTNPLADEKLQDIVEYWGSMTCSMLSLYMASTSGDSWRNMADPLQEVGTFFYILFLVYIGFFMFVVVNTLTSLFIEATIQHGSDDNTIAIMEEVKKKDQYVQKISALYKNVDVDASGDISLEEFRQALRTPEMIALSRSLDIDISDADEFFKLISANGRYAVDIETFVIGCMKLKGNAKSIDLMSLTNIFKQFAKEWDEMSNAYMGQLQVVQKALSAAGIPVEALPSSRPSPRQRRERGVVAKC